MNKAKIPYGELDKYFIAPKRISPFCAENIRIPRRLKKKVKQFCWVFWYGLTNGQRLWYYMEESNQDYKRFLIKKVIGKDAYGDKGLSENNSSGQ